MIDAEKIHRLQVLWKKNREYFQTFLTELGEVRAQFGNDRDFAKWCVTDLHISIGVITNTVDILKKSDASVAKDELRRAKEAERLQKKEELERKRSEKQAEMIAKKELAKKKKKAIADRKYRKKVKKKLSVSEQPLALTE
jgi:hypothetical protein